MGKIETNQEIYIFAIAFLRILKPLLKPFIINSNCSIEIKVTKLILRLVFKRV